jgi:DNA-binding CsgD family transcriptional regulator
MKPWDRILTLLRMKPSARRHVFELDEPLQAALAERAEQVQHPVEQVEAEMLREGLEHLQSSDRLKQCWERLSGREQEVTALTCLGYTNRQMAARLQLSPGTVKGYVREAMVKWRANGKDELRLLLAQWDFSDWGARAE